MEELGSAERERLFARHGKRFTAGQVIFREGEGASEVYLLHDGRVRLSKRVRTVERSLRVLRAGELFGECALLAGSSHGTTALALSDVAAIALDARAMEGVLRDPALAAPITAQLVRRLRDAEDQVALMMLGDPQSRVVSALLLLAQHASPELDGTRVLYVSPTELAAYVGLDVYAVKRAVQRLRESAYVRVLDAKIEIPSLEPLRRLLAVLAAKEDIDGRSPRADEVPAGPGRRG